MLVPLRTLPGWPEADDPSLLVQLGLFLGLPAAFLLIMWVWGYTGRLIAKSRGETGPEIEHPLSIYGLETPEQYVAAIEGRSSGSALEPVASTSDTR